MNGVVLGDTGIESNIDKNKIAGKRRARHAGRAISTLNETDL
jgi:hypothetical protein